MINNNEEQFYNEFYKYTLYHALLNELNQHQNKLQIATDEVFNKALEPLLPKYHFDSKTEIFTMDFNFVPYLKID